MTSSVIVRAAHRGNPCGLLDCHGPESPRNDGIPATFDYTLDTKASKHHQDIIEALKERDKQGVGDGVREDIRRGSRSLLDDVKLFAQAVS